MKSRQIISSTLFSQTMNKEALLDACVTDFCYCSHSNRQQCACDGISVFAKECQFQGATLNSDWRDVGLCRKFDNIHSNISTNFHLI